MNGAMVPGRIVPGRIRRRCGCKERGWLVVTTNVAGSVGLTVPNVPESRAMPGKILLSVDFIVKV